MKNKLLPTLLLFLSSIVLQASDSLLVCVSDFAGNGSIVGAVVRLTGSGTISLTDESGCVSILPGINDRWIEVSAMGYAPCSMELGQASNGNLKVRMETQVLGEAVISDRSEKEIGFDRLRQVDGFGIYTGKKSELVIPELQSVNLSQNQARQIFGKVAGLNIWEDASGLQLGIGARGLDPNRSSNFTIRQDGTDISADPLGYPESYYTPPLQAVERIEVVRGTSALQYGSQFGGMINFVMKEGREDKPIHFSGEAGWASFATRHAYQQIDGKIKGFRYLAAYSYRCGDGWRPNSGFESHSAFLAVGRKESVRFNWRLSYSHLNYLAQQPGGLTDTEFLIDPQQSKRERNWFRVNWNTLSLRSEWQLASQSALELRAFGLLSSREALGFLGFISRVDPGTERDLIKGTFHNGGVELRWKQHHRLFNMDQTLVTGIRQFHGATGSEQGFGDDGSGPSFGFIESSLQASSDFDFLSSNQAFFAENVLFLNEKLSITPGLRLERIRTGSDGFYTRVERDGAGNVLPGYPLTIQDHRSEERFVTLIGAGIQYSPGEYIEFFANFTTNYRAINFSDLYINVPGLLIDPEIEDESGCSADLGLRWKPGKAVYLEASGFLLDYNDRIGLVLTTTDDPYLGTVPIRMRTNIADARIIGVEFLLEAELLELIGTKSQNWRLAGYTSGAVLQSEYLNASVGVEGNQIEFAPPLVVRAGIKLGYKQFEANYRFSYTSDQFSDATNAPFRSDPNAIAGAIPAWWVSDLGFSYSREHWGIKAGVNNLFDALYFTRRATGYPGPGILPSDARSIYTSLSYKF